ncbi:MAG TPA: ribosome recycling factor, partial [Chloroflexota bacterium]
MEDILGRAEAKMKSSIEVLRKELGSIRTGRASPGLVENLHVEYYGTEMPLKQLAN